MTLYPLHSDTSVDLSHMLYLFSLCAVKCMGVACTVPTLLARHAERVAKQAVMFSFMFAALGIPLLATCAPLRPLA